MNQVHVAADHEEAARLLRKKRGRHRIETDTGALALARIGRHHGALVAGAITILLAAWFTPLTASLPQVAEPSRVASQSGFLDVAFRTHDDLDMYGKLTLPEADPPRAVVVYVQTAEGMTVDMRRPDGRGNTFDYFDLYRAKLEASGVGFFSYEGRGIHMGDSPPRYEKIERELYDTSTLANKVRDLLCAVRAVRSQPGLAEVRVLLLGASEGTLLAARAAAQAPSEIQALVLYGVMSENMRAIFTYILSEGAFLTYRGFFDVDEDGEITRTEFEADPQGFRASALGGVSFEQLDLDADGRIGLGDLTTRAKPLLEAVQREDFRLLDQWARLAAGVSTPKDWFKDHFAQEPIWTSLVDLDMPVGFFHGARDANTPIAGVKALEAKARAAGKTRFRFAYFDELDHSLGIGAYFATGTLPTGHQAIFAFIDEVVDGP